MARLKKFVFDAETLGQVERVTVKASSYEKAVSKLYSSRPQTDNATCLTRLA